jgi:hypothetical protein
MSKAQVQIPVSFKQQVRGQRDLLEHSEPVYQTWRIWYRDCFDMEQTFTKDHDYHGPVELIRQQVQYEMGHYGGIKAELIKGDKE